MSDIVSCYRKQPPARMGLRPGGSLLLQKQAMPKIYRWEVSALRWLKYKARDNPALCSVYCAPAIDSIYDYQTTL